MNRRSKIGIAATGLVLVGLLAMSLALAGCGSTSAKALTGKLTLSGSTTVLPLAQEAADMFMTDNPKVTVTVQGGGSSVGVTQVSQGVVNIGNSSRDLNDTEKNLGLVDHQVAYDVIAIIVNPSVGITNLTSDQAKAVFSGTAKNWNQVGGANAPITVVIRDSSSGTREIFDQKVLGAAKTAPDAPGAIETNSNGIMRQTVASTPNSVGYISLGYIDKTVKSVSLNGVQPTLANGLNKTYPLARYLHMFTKGEATGLAKSYIDFVLTPNFQNVVVAKDYVPMTKIPGSPSTTTPTSK
jgi:phosphate transport system substrate-binding protein